jgi:hypothetical protein
MLRAAKLTSKKPYQTPQLLRYGSLLDMTKTGGKGMMDMTNGNSMT